jgi:small subunit ribosomal protein S4
MHGRQAQFSRKESDFGLQLREKQKVRRLYGVFERQFRRYFHLAQRQKGMTGENMLILLESRLDNVVYRLGLASSRPQARQLISHGHFDINGRKTNVPSYLVSVGDTIVVREHSKKTIHFKDLAKELDDSRIPTWLSLDAKNLSGRVVELPTRNQIDVALNEQLIVEFYSR